MLSIFAKCLAAISFLCLSSAALNASQLLVQGAAGNPPRLDDKLAQLNYNGEGRSRLFIIDSETGAVLSRRDLVPFSEVIYIAEEGKVILEEPQPDNAEIWNFTVVSSTNLERQLLPTFALSHSKFHPQTGVGLEMGQRASEHLEANEIACVTLNLPKTNASIGIVDIATQSFQPVADISFEEVYGFLRSKEKDAFIFAKIDGTILNFRKRSGRWQMTDFGESRLFNGIQHGNLVGCDVSHAPFAIIGLTEKDGLLVNDGGTNAFSIPLNSSQQKSGYANVPILALQNSRPVCVVGLQWLGPDRELPQTELFKCDWSAKTINTLLKDQPPISALYLANDDTYYLAEWNVILRCDQKGNVKRIVSLPCARIFRIWGL